MGGALTLGALRTTGPRGRAVPTTLAAWTAGALTVAMRTARTPLPLTSPAVPITPTSRGAGTGAVVAVSAAIVAGLSCGALSHGMSFRRFWCVGAWPRIRVLQTL